MVLFYEVATEHTAANIFLDPEEAFLQGPVYVGLTTMWAVFEKFRLLQSKTVPMDELSRYRI